MAEIELLQFEGSHFNEKARWGLEWKGIEYRKVSLLPGPHAPRIKRLTGRTEVPVLVEGERVVAGSAAILDHLERTATGRALYPADPALRLRALALQQEFDEEVGPAIRLAMFFEAMDADFALAVFGKGTGALKRLLYRGVFPLVAPLMRRSMQIDAPNAERARERTRRAFDFVAKQAGPEGYLVGRRFSVADLTAAALLMPGVRTGEWGGPTPADLPKVRAWYERWADHPGAEWVREIYRRHRRS